jgi:hypothetical protein
MYETDFDRVIDAVRKEIASAPVERSLAVSRGIHAPPKAAGEMGTARRQARVFPMTRIRRLGERQKRYR